METNLDKNTRPLEPASHERQASGGSILEQCYWATVDALKQRIEADPEFSYQEAVAQQQEALSIKEDPQYKYILDASDTDRVKNYMAHQGAFYKEVFQKDTYYLISDTIPSFRTEALLLRQEWSVDDQESDGYEKLIYKSQPSDVKDGSHTRVAIETKVNLPQAPELVDEVLLEQILTQDLESQYEEFQIEKKRTSCITSIPIGDSQIFPVVHLDENLKIGDDKLAGHSFLEISLPDANKEAAEEFLRKELGIWTRPIGLPYINSDFTGVANGLRTRRKREKGQAYHQSADSLEQEMFGQYQPAHVDSNGDLIPGASCGTEEDIRQLCELLDKEAEVDKTKLDRTWSSNKLERYPKAKAGFYLMHGDSSNEGFKNKVETYEDDKKQIFASLCLECISRYKIGRRAGARLHFTTYEPGDGSRYLISLWAGSHDKQNKKIPEAESWCASDALREAAKSKADSKP